MAIEDPLGLVGKKIDDKYEIESVVGEGGFAVVYRAKHLIFKRPVAIKAFKALKDFDAEERDRLVQGFVQEGALLADLSERTASIVQARDVGTLQNSKGDWIPYMVLEWLEGASLEGLLLGEREQGLAPRSIEQAVALLDPAAEALAFAHRKGIAHRDIKPANIFIVGDPNGDYTVKLLDFGIAKVVQDAQKETGSFQKTAGHVTSFTPAYGAPEQFSRSHGATGPWTDVFSLALVAVEVATQKEPLEGDSFVQLGYAASNPARRPTPRTLGAVVSDEVEAVFQKALSVAIDERYQTAGDFWNALREALSMKPLRSLVPSDTTADPRARTVAVPLSDPSLPHSTGKPVVTAPTPPSSSSNKGLLVGAAALVLVAGGIGAFVALNKSGGTTPTTSASGVMPSASQSVAAPHKPSCPDGMIMIEGGEFFMGSSEATALDNEKPAHSVKLNSYCIDRTEVTTDAYKACSDVGKCPPAGKDNVFGGLTDPLKKVLDPLCNIREPSGKGKHPINCVDWEMAANFCTKGRDARLPTEAEWEYAARGPDGRAYPWGDEKPSARYLNACGKECMVWGKKNNVMGSVTFASMFDEDDAFANTAPVGSFPDGKSRYGLEDVVGNVWEWTADFYAEYTKDAQTDPQGPKSGEERVARGGAWNGSQASWVRPTFRFYFDPTSRSYGIGFRCASQAK